MVHHLRGVRVDGAKVRQLRKLRFLTQAKLAERAGITAATLSRLENGPTSAVETVEKVSQVLGVAPEWLLKDPSLDAALGNGREVLDLSDAGTAFMDRIEAGEDEELAEDEEAFFELIGKYRRKLHSEDLARTVNGYQRSVAQGLAALSRRDRGAGAEAIERVLGRLREEGGG